MRALVFLVLFVLGACAQTTPKVDPASPPLYHDPGNDTFCAAHPNEGTCQ